MHCRRQYTYLVSASNKSLLRRASRVCYIMRIVSNITKVSRSVTNELYGCLLSCHMSRLLLFVFVAVFNIVSGYVIVIIIIVVVVVLMLCS